MFAQLGDIVFENVLGPETLSISGEESFVELPRINNRPKVDHTGTGLRTISMTIQFHFSFCTPEDNIDAMWKHKESADILTFVLGNGRIIGDFVIASLNEAPIQTSPDGTYICARLNITLKEIYAEIKTIQRQQSAVKTALAINSSDTVIIPVRQRSTEWITNMWKITEAIMIGKSIAAAIANVVKYASVPEFWAMFSQQIGVYVVNAINSNNDVIDTMGADTSLALLCPDLTASATAHLAALTALQSGMPIADFDALSLLNDDVQSSFAQMQKDAQAIFVNVILRR